MPCLHLVAERLDISTGGALVIDIDGSGAANFIFSHSSSAARAAVVFGCRRRGSDGSSMCDLAHGGDIRVWEASSSWQPRLRSECNRQSLLRWLWRHRHHIGCVRAARSPSTATRPAHLLHVALHVCNMIWQHARRMERRTRPAARKTAMAATAASGSTPPQQQQYRVTDGRDGRSCSWRKQRL